MLVYWFLPMILFLGIVTSYEDIKYGKIRNKWVLLSISYSLVTYSIFLALGDVNMGYFKTYLMNALLSLAVGFALWHLSLWTAGDAKLFFTYSVLVPPDIYQFRLFSFFPAANLLLFAFIPLSLFYFFASIISIFKNKQFGQIVKSISVPEIMTAFLFLFSVGWVFRISLGYLGIPFSGLNIILMLSLLLVIGKITKSWINLALAIIALLRFFLDAELSYASEWLTVLALFSAFLLIRITILNKGLNFLSKTIKISRLKEGLIPAELILKMGSEYRKAPLAYKGSPLIPKNAMPLFKINPNGLSKSDVVKIIKLSKKFPFGEIKISQAISFAPVLFFSAAANVLLGMLL